MDNENRNNELTEDALDDVSGGVRGEDGGCIPDPKDKFPPPPNRDYLES